MQLVDYSDSEPDEPVPPPMHLPCVVAGEQALIIGHAAAFLGVPYTVTTRQYVIRVCIALRVAARAAKVAYEPWAFG
jgi:hypothetical protein